MTELVAMVLAAGTGSRFAGDDHKLLAQLPATIDRPAESVAARSLAHAVEARIGTVLIVTGAIDISDTIDLDAMVHGLDVDIDVLHNAGYADGQMSSVRVGLAAAEERGARRVVIGLADQPGITSAAWRRVAAAGDGAAIAVATYDGARGNPVALRSDVWDLLPEGGDEGARQLMRLRPELVVEVPCSGSSEDIDTVEDLHRWQSNSSTNSP